MSKQTNPPATATTETQSSSSPLAARYATAAAATIWTALAQLAATPFYLRFLGVERYGLVAFYITLQATLQILDLGITTTVTREVARLRSHTLQGGHPRSVFRTFERVYWLLSIAVVASLAGGSGLIARHWFRGSLGQAEMRRAISAMALVWAFQWLVSLYQAVLVGQERLITASALRIVMVTIFHASAIVLLWQLHVGAAGMFLAQAAVGAVHVSLLLVALRTRNSQGGQSVAPPPPVEKRFVVSIAAVSVVGALLAQTDKLILSHVLTLEDFARYSVASLLASGALVAIVPLFSTIMPRLTFLVGTEDRAGILALYRRASEACAVFTVVPACAIIFFGNDILLLWTRLPELARQTAPVAALLIAGTAMNGLMTPSYALQIAHGRTAIALKIGVVQLLVFAPLVYILGSRFGLIAAAAAWPIIHLGYIGAGIPMTHRAFFGTRGAEWIRDVAPPIVAAIAVMAIGQRFIPTGGLQVRIAWLCAVSAVAVLTSTMAASKLRPMITAPILRRRVS